MKMKHILKSVRKKVLGVASGEYLKVEAQLEISRDLE